LLPCAVPISWTPRSAIVARPAPRARSDLVDDDDLGHVVLDRLDHHLVLERRRADLHPARLADRRVRDVAVAGDLVAGVDDHHALAHVVGQDAGGLAEHRGLADPGRPMIRIDFPVSTKSLMISIVPNTARPIRHVSPTILPFRFRIALIRWSVRSMPARLSSPNEPMCSTTNAMSSSTTSRSSRLTSASGKRPSGRRPRSMTTSIRADRSGRR
jgi:hypothetical protein